MSNYPEGSDTKWAPWNDKENIDHYPYDEEKEEDIKEEVIYEIPDRYDWEMNK